MLNDPQPTSNHSSHPEATWQIASTVLDILVPIDEVSGNTISKRPYLIAVVDASGDLRGINLTIEPIDDAALEEFMRKIGVLVNGDQGYQRSTEIWTDNGYAFCKLGFLEKYGIRVARSSPRYPWGQGKVERMFREINENLLPTVLSWEAFRTAFDNFMHQYNARQARSGEEDTNVEV